MEYGKILKQSWETTWRNKVMWFLGMMVLSGGWGGGNVNFPAGEYPSETDIPVAFDNIGFVLVDVFHEYWYLFVILGLLMLLLILVSLVLHYTALGALYYGADKARQGKKPKFGEMFMAGIRKFWPVLGLHFIIGIVVFGVILAISIPLILLAFSIVGLIIVIPAVIVLAIVGIPFGIALKIIKIYATQYIVLRDRRVVDSFKDAWQLFRNKLGNTIVMYLLSILVRFGVGLVTFGIILVVLIPFALIGFIAYNASSWIAVAVVAGMALLILFVVLMFVKGVKQTYLFNLWHLTFDELESEKKA